MDSEETRRGKLAKFSFCNKQLEGVAHTHSNTQLRTVTRTEIHFFNGEKRIKTHLQLFALEHMYALGKIAVPARSPGLTAVVWMADSYPL